MTPFFENTRRILAVLIGFFIPISTALTNILCPLAFLLILAEAQYQQKFLHLRQHPVALAGIFLFTIILIGFFYTSVPFNEALKMADKYREFIYISFFIIIFRDTKTRIWGLYAFLTAMGLTLFLSYLMALTGWQFGKGEPQNAFVFKDYITQSILMALAAYFVAVQAWNERRWLWSRGIIVMLAVGNIIFLNEGRSGYLVLFCLIFLFSYQFYRLRGIILGSLLLALLSLGAYQYSDVVRQRIDRVSEGVQNYQAGKVITSVELRLEFYKNSLELMAQKPLFGYGTGSFAFEYQKIAKPQHITLTTNPHNEYLMIGVQWGLLGLALFLYLLYVLWQTANRYLTPSEMYKAHGLIVTIMVGGLVNSLWLDNTEGHIFAYLIGVLYGGLNLKPSQSMQPQTKFWPFSLSRFHISLLKRLFVSLLILILLLIAYRALVLPPAANVIAESVAQTLRKAATTTFHSEPNNTRSFNLAFAFDKKGNTLPVDTQFYPQIQTDKSSQDNPITVNVLDNVTISTHIQVDPRHVGKAASIIMMIVYQPAHDNTLQFFQRNGDNWESWPLNQLKIAHYYSQLPENINLLVYKGPVVVAAGQVRILSAYALEDDSLVLNQQPLKFMVK